jgi:hypothetical protein
MSIVSAAMDGPVIVRIPGIRAKFSMAAPSPTLSCVPFAKMAGIGVASCLG